MRIFLPMIKLFMKEPNMIPIVVTHMDIGGGCESVSIKIALSHILLLDFIDQICSDYVEDKYHYPRTLHQGYI